MSIKDRLLPEYGYEMSSTRRLLERVPDDKAAWKPHEKSMSLMQLAAHLAELPAWVGGIKAGEFDLGGYEAPKVNTRQELLDFFDRCVALGREELESASDEDLQGDFTLRAGEQVYFTQPKLGVYRGMVMNHHIHHRGQLTVYLRENDVPLPAIYGPSADEDIS